jgi:hypothetical protein
MGTDIQDAVDAESRQESRQMPVYFLQQRRPSKDVIAELAVDPSNDEAKGL